MAQPGHPSSPQRVEQIAIDGPAASGKSTVARGLARELGAWYLNTGEMYRAVAWQALVRGLDPETRPDAVAAMLPGLDMSFQPGDHQQLALSLNGEPVPESVLRGPEVTAKVSAVAAMGPVRERLVAWQRQARHWGVLVMEGRDIGTVVFPEARHKFFLTATPEERARRRLAQRGEVVDGATLASVAEAIAERDRLDSTRPIAPLRPAPDAVVFDSTGWEVEAVIAHLAGLVRQRWATEAASSAPA